jgi:hypothetical protein
MAQSHTVALTITRTPVTAITRIHAVALTLTRTPVTSITRIHVVALTITRTPASSTSIQLSKALTITRTVNPPLVLQFIDLDNYPMIEWSASKNINDALWKFSGSVELHDIPGTFKNLRAIMPDHADVDHCVFMGFIPGADYKFGTAKKTAQMDAYDHGWYLASQVVPLRITDKDTNPATTLKTMLGDDDWAAKTGLNCVDGHINDVVDWTGAAGVATQKSFEWKLETKKQTAINDMCDYSGSIFYIKYKAVGGIWYTVAYFVADDAIDGATGFDLSAKVTFTKPDPYVINISKSLDESDKVNRIIVYATNREDGTWKTKTKESPEVTSGAEIPIEMVIPGYVVEPPPASDAALQTAADEKADELYGLFYTNATTTIINATLARRADLELWQKVAFSGYSNISSADMRIVGITYKHTATNDTVEIQCIPIKDMSNATARRMALKLDYVSGLRDVIADEVRRIVEAIEIGEVTAISGTIATIELEADGMSVSARVLNPSA